jgi:Fic family protein
MPELPIHPAFGREAPGYSLERRLTRLKSLEPDRRRATHESLRERTAAETLRLTGGAHGEGPLLDGALEALAHIETAASSGREIDVSLIREVHRLSSAPSGGEIRNSDLPPQFRNARILSPRFIEARLANLLDWLHGDSGRRMFPAERMALWFPRFLEIAPFERGNFRTAHIFLSFFSCSDGYPPVSLKFDEAEEVRAEVERALLFDTGPLVMRFSAALSRALEALEQAEREGS